MSEHDENIRMILVAAIGAAGPRGSNEAQWMAKINSAIPPIAAMFNDGTKQWKTALAVLEADIFVATYRGYVIEESSTRCLVTLETKPSKRYPDGIEPIRSHRTDTQAGKDMEARLKQLEPGREIVVWKAMEQFAGDEDQKVRILVHLQTTFRKSEPTERQVAAPDPPPEEHPEPPAAPPIAPSDAIDSERLSDWRAGARRVLTAAQQKELAETLAAKGYSFDGVSEIEWDEIVRPIIREMRHG